jgi:tRNA-specific 2-thiouridylase
MKQKPVVAIAMSGGVDSSVAAALLVAQGYSVIGMMLKLWNEQESDQSNRCCTPDSIALARRVASIISIPFYVLDARQIFYDHVIQSFIDGYAHNATPNPCVVCNRSIRWEFLLDHALSAGADFLATGHYARVIHPSEHVYQLLRGVDPSKDQSYVLHVLTQDQLKHALFPLGEFTKQEVRQMAHQYNLPSADRPDSQDLCFLGANGDYRRFLARYAPQTLNPGPIINLQEKVLGTHQGLAFFTVGQRKGINISSPVPIYVLAKDSVQNALIVGTREESFQDHLIAHHANWIDGNPPSAAFNASIKIRYNAHRTVGKVSIIDDSSFSVEFEKPVTDITPGQSAVLYNGDICLGGGVISAD